MVAASPERILKKNKKNFKYKQNDTKSLKQMLWNHILFADLSVCKKENIMCNKVPWEWSVVSVKPLTPSLLEG